MRVYKRSKILATVGPASNSYETIKDMILAGVNGFRLNFSHGSYEERSQQIDWIRQASAEVNKPVAILQDLQGPKIRLGDFEGDIAVSAGEEWQLTYGEATDEQNKLLESQYDLSTKVKPGERLFLFDGKVHSRIAAVEGTRVRIVIENDGSLKQRKGLNLPDTDFGGDIITEKDRRDLEFGATQDIDYVALSFVQTANDVHALRQLLKDQGSTAHVIAKVETKAAIDDEELERVVEASDGVMVARGDLAVEVSAEVVPIVQRQIIGLCQKHGKLSIVATQMMASMVDNPSPTRAEVSDVAGAVISGADCVMLSDETANGNYVLEVVRSMKKVIVYTQEHAPVQPVYYRADKPEKQDAISSAAVTLAQQLNATAIVVETKTGATAQSIAEHRPSAPIFSVTSNPRTAQQLALMYANKSFLEPDGEHAGLDLAKRLRRENIFPPQTTVVLVSGRQPGIPGATDTIRVRILE